MSDNKPNKNGFFREFLTRYLEDKKKSDQNELQKAAQEERERKQAIKDYRAWKKKQKPEAEKAAKQILEWTNNFFASEFYQEILRFNRSVSDFAKIEILGFSETISYKRPSKYGGTETHYQFLYLELKTRKASVSNAVKYGKHYEIDTVEDMLEKVDPPVIIQVAETIGTGEIWDIVKKDLSERR